MLNDLTENDYIEVCLMYTQEEKLQLIESSKEVERFFDDMEYSKGFSTDLHISDKEGKAIFLDKDSYLINEENKKALNLISKFFNEELTVLNTPKKDNVLIIPIKRYFEVKENVKKNNWVDLNFFPEVSVSINEKFDKKIPNYNCQMIRTDGKIVPLTLRSSEDDFYVSSDMFFHDEQGNLL